MNFHFTHGIKCSCGRIENQNRCILEEGAHTRSPLFIATRAEVSTLKSTNERFGVRGLRRSTKVRKVRIAE
ncbi:MAG TPA: hypothetical protein VM432_02785 [Bdellovibrionales bacterium]|nr:hypothetical protein [Bdellovibrionales bacterium]